MEKPKLYRCAFKVRPALNHPQYWNIQHGALVIWTFANDANLALSAAHLIVQGAPYEVLSEVASVTTQREHETNAFYRIQIELAKQVGFSCYFNAYPVGSDVSESDFINHWKNP